MAKHTNPEASANGKPRSTSFHFAQLWQVPTFLFGMLALASLLAARPLWSNPPGSQIERHLAAARRGLEEPRPDFDNIIGRIEQVLGSERSSPVQQGEAYFLLGSVSLRRGEQSSGEVAVMFWQQAKAHLERARERGVPPADDGKLTYRLARVQFFLNAEPERVLEALQRTITVADDPFEAYGMLAQTHLRLPTPNLRAALEATQKQLAQANVVDEAMLAQPRLLCGELLRKLEQPEEACKVLARIGSGAPPHLIFQARYLRATILQEEGIWTEAAQMWETIRTDPRTAGAGLGKALYSLGHCYRKLEQPVSAAAIWEEAGKLGGEEAQAAALGLAELRLHGNEPAAALEAFQAALRHVASPADYRNGLIDLTEARGLFEAGCRWYLQIGKFEAALQLSRLYERLALPGVGQELGGQAAEAWAKTLLEQARRAPTPEGARQEEEEARKRFCEAAALFEAAASQGRSQAEQADWLWRSANNYLQGHDARRALPVLERFVGLPTTPDRLGEAWYVRGEAFRALRNRVAAQADYRHCIKFPGRYAYWARYQLAVLELEQNNLEEAETILTQNLALIDLDAEADPEVREKTLYALAALLFQRRDFHMAYVRLQEALSRYPDNESAFCTRYQLAQCCRHLAEQASQKINDEKATPDVRIHYRTQRQRYLELAAGHFQKLSEDYSALGGQRPLTAEEDSMARLTAFAVGECQFDLGRFDEALGHYEALSRRYRGQVEELIALRHVWQCHGVKFQPDQARRLIERIRAALKELPSSAFDNNGDLRTRRWWDDWLREKSRAAT
ncbi:MAG: hypothetical protein JNM56_37365 [Planctomycetia bacterium]|nr:hypothetical protein [Planctomycetia bacterium]